MADFLNPLFLLINYLFVPGLAYACQLALGALGITLLFSILRFSNFAFGEMMSTGAMITIFIVWGFQGVGLTFGVIPTALFALPIAVAISIVVALGTDKVVYSYYRKKKVEPVIMLIVSMGVMFAFAGINRFFIGTEDRVFADGARFIIKARDVKQSLGLAEGITLKTSQLITIITTVIATVWLFWFLDKTKTGKMMRAYSDNEDLALLSGINPDRIVKITWIIAAVLATVAGVLYGLDKSYKPFVFQQLLLPIFAAAIVGGLGNPVGAVLGGFVVAFSEVILTYTYKKFFMYVLPASWLPDGLAQFLPTDYKFAVSFAILVLVLLFRPTGIMKGKVI